MSPFPKILTALVKITVTFSKVTSQSPGGFPASGEVYIHLIFHPLAHINIWANMSSLCSYPSCGSHFPEVRKQWEMILTSLSQKTAVSGSFSALLSNPPSPPNLAPHHPPAPHYHPHPCFPPPHKPLSGTSHLICSPWNALTWDFSPFLPISSQLPLPFRVPRSNFLSLPNRLSNTMFQGPSSPALFFSLLRTYCCLLWSTRFTCLVSIMLQHWGFMSNSTIRLWLTMVHRLTRYTGLRHTCCLTNQCGCFGLKQCPNSTGSLGVWETKMTCDQDRSSDSQCPELVKEEVLPGSGDVECTRSVLPILSSCLSSEVLRCASALFCTRLGLLYLHHPAHLLPPTPQPCSPPPHSPAHHRPP